MELSKLTAAFFLRFDGRIHSSMTKKQMEMMDMFSASPVAAKLVLSLTEMIDEPS